MTDPERTPETPEERRRRLAEQAREEQERKWAEVESNLDSAFEGFGYVLMPNRPVPEPILNETVRRNFAEWLTEQNCEAQLRMVGLKPRTRMLLDGPPGCGKTSLAHFLAARIKLPMVVVVASTINSKYVGESASNVGKLFRAARRSPDGVVLFLDEFDAIARDRAGGHTHSEGEGTTISVLAELDRHDGIVFGATNQPDKIDSAVQRRFNMRVDIGLPGDAERQKIVRLYLSPLQVDERIVRALAMELEKASPALIRDVCEAIKRGLVLAPELDLDPSLSALVRRGVASIKPHETMAVPKLWGGVAEGLKRLELASQGCWPPSLPN